MYKASGCGCNRSDYYECDPCDRYEPRDELSMPLAKAYVLPQKYCKTFPPNEALANGTIFPDLASQYGS